MEKKINILWSFGPWFSSCIDIVLKMKNCDWCFPVYYYYNTFKMAWMTESFYSTSAHVCPHLPVCRKASLQAWGHDTDPQIPQKCSGWGIQPVGSEWFPSFLSSGAVSHTAPCQRAGRTGITFNYSTWRSMSKGRLGTQIHILSTHEFPSHFHWLCTHHGLLILIGFDAADKEGLTHTQCAHQQLQRTFKLTAQSWGTLSRLRPLNTRKHTYAYRKRHTKKQSRVWQKAHQQDLLTPFWPLTLSVLLSFPLPQHHL